MKTTRTKRWWTTAVVAVPILLHQREGMAATAAPVEIEIEDDAEPAEPEPASPPSEPATEPAPPTGEASQPAAPGAPEPTPSEQAPPQQPAAESEPAALRSELAALRAEVEELKAQAESERAVAPPETPKPPKEEPSRPRAIRGPFAVGYGPLVHPSDYGVRLGGYLQVQYEWNQMSEDQLLQGGTTLNRNRFLVRRGRLQLSGDWKHVAFGFEVDASTTRGLFVGIRQAHVSGVWRNPDPSRPPWIMVTAGLTEVPFGYELRLGQREMPFMERSTGSLAFFPGPVDVGLRARGGVGPVRYDLAVMNGSPIDDRAGGLSGIDPTSKPDFAGRVGVETKPRRVVVAAGASFLAGTGFHAGQDATKNHLQWQDLNESGTLDTGETIAVPGTAATPSFTFRHWAVGADVQLGVRSKAGWTRILGEATLASNLDRGLLVSDPILVGADVRQLQAYGAVVQDLFRWALVGFRYDFYDPDLDLLDQRRGRRVPVNGAFHTFSPLVGALLPDGLAGKFRGRIVLQYDAVRDALGRDGRGVPTDLKNDQITVRVQGEF